MHSDGISSLQLLAQSTIQDRKPHLSSARVTGYTEVGDLVPVHLGEDWSSVTPQC
jgi:hypothetical protein